MRAECDLIFLQTSAVILAWCSLQVGWRPKEPSCLLAYLSVCGTDVAWQHRNIVSTNPQDGQMSRKTCMAAGPALICSNPCVLQCWHAQKKLHRPRRCDLHALTLVSEAPSREDAKTQPSLFVTYKPTPFTCSGTLRFHSRGRTPSLPSSTPRPASGRPSSFQPHCRSILVPRSQGCDALRRRV